MSNSIQKQTNKLPENISQLKKFVLIGRDKLISVRAEIQAITKMDMASGVLEQKREEAQLLAEALLDAEVKMGDILKKDSGSTAGTTKTLPEGIGKKQSHYYQTMSDNKHVVKEVKQKAKENDELPTRTEVLNLVKRYKKEKIHEKAKTENDFGVCDISDIKKKYSVLYVDPPWGYEERQMGGTSSASANYNTMSINEICDLAIPVICKSECILFLWVTSPQLDVSFKVINSWGFKYKSSFIWDKVKHNMGHYNSVRHEFLLICTKGSMTPFNKKLYDSVVTEPRTEHSKKPDVFYEIIDTLYPNTNKIEIFARSKRKGWDSWGNQA